MLEGKSFPREDRLRVHIKARVRMGKLWLNDGGQSCVEIEQQGGGLANCEGYWCRRYGDKSLSPGWFFPFAHQFGGGKQWRVGHHI